MTKHGFTLAEVLVTLGIIGVVSAMTIPTLVKNHQRQVFVTQLQKVVNEISQAADRAIQDNNAVSLDETKYGTNKAYGASRFLNDYFKIAKNCGTTATPCFASSYETLNGDTYTIREPIVAVSLANGASLLVVDAHYYAPYWKDSDDNIYYEDWHSYYQIQVDVNGAQGPNIAGRDLFGFELYKDGKVSSSYTNGQHGDSDDMLEGCSDNYDGYSAICFEKIMQDGWKMDY